jgi:hypothetical protein
MPERQEAKLPEGASGRLATAVAPHARTDPTSPLCVDVLQLQRRVGNRATARAILSLRRQTVQTAHGWAAFFLVVAALNLASGCWYLAIARAAPA